MLDVNNFLGGGVSYERTESSLRSSLERNKSALKKLQQDPDGYIDAWMKIGLIFLDPKAWMIREESIVS